MKERERSFSDSYNNETVSRNKKLKEKSNSLTNLFVKEEKEEKKDNVIDLRILDNKNVKKLENYKITLRELVIIYSVCEEEEKGSHSEKSNSVSSEKSHSFSITTQKETLPKR
jgi:hypothetical protein